MIEELSVFRVIIGFAFMGYASYSDIKTREIYDFVWYAMGIIGIIFIAIEIIFGYFLPLNFIFSLFFGIMLGMLLHKFNFGGADVKAIIALAILFPIFPNLTLFGVEFPITGIPLINIFILSIVTNSLIIGLFSPIYIFIHNLLKMEISPYMFIGYNVDIMKLKEMRHIRFVHNIDFETGKCEFIWGGIELDENGVYELEKMAQKNILNRVWITPELPFIVYIMLGLIATIFYGDIIYSLMH